MAVTVTVTVYPEEGEFPRIARALLDAADNPQQVQAVSHPRMGFVVPEEVFERFHAAEAQLWERADETSDSVPQQEEQPVPRRRGRPRKVVPPVQETEVVVVQEVEVEQPQQKVEEQ